MLPDVYCDKELHDGLNHLSIFEQAVSDGFMGAVNIADAGIDECHQDPNKAGRQDDRLALAQMKFIFKGYDGIGHDEQNQT